MRQPCQYPCACVSFPVSQYSLTAPSNRQQRDVGQYKFLSGRAKLKEHRADIFTSLSEFLTARFSKVLDDPIIKAMSALDFRKWPTETKALENYGNQDIQLLFKAYQGFYDETTTEDEVIDQWCEIKSDIVSSPGLLLLSFHEMWSRMLVHDTERYLLVLRIVVFMLLLP